MFSGDIDTSSSPRTCGRLERLRPLLQPCWRTAQPLATQARKAFKKQLNTPDCCDTAPTLSRRSSTSVNSCGSLGGRLRCDVGRWTLRRRQQGCAAEAEAWRALRARAGLSGFCNPSSGRHNPSVATKHRRPSIGKDF